MGILGRLIGSFRALRAHRLDIALVTPSLMLGAAPASARLSQLAKRRVSAAVDLRTSEERSTDAGWDAAATRAGIDVLRLPTPDESTPSPEALAQGTEWLLQCLAQDRIVLVCCRAGARRSVTFATATLIAMGYPLPEAFRLVAKARSVANPSDVQLEALRQFAETRATKKPPSP